MIYELIPQDIEAYQWSPEIPDKNVKSISNKYIFIDENAFSCIIVKGDYIITEKDGHRRIMNQKFFEVTYKKKVSS
jgi:hypothetical protein